MVREERPESTELDVPGKRPEPRYGGALLALALAAGFGALIMVGYAAQTRTLAEFFSVAGGALLIGGASLLVGGLIGFLFGIPRSSPEKERQSTEEEIPTASARERARYRPNTNLEEISDWLTKILVGVGLTQLTAVPAGLQGMGQVLAPILGGLPGSEVFAIGALVYFSLCGFFMSFLWTRLALPGLSTEAELLAAVGLARQEGLKIGSLRFLESARKASAFSENAQKASAPQELQEKLALWVDDRPENNVRERELMGPLLRLRFETALSTSEALAKIEREGEKYSLVISDMGRPGDPRAGYTLLEQLRAKGFQKPFIIYAGSSRPEHDAEARRRGAEGSTNNPQVLLDLVRNALERAA